MPRAGIRDLVTFELPLKYFEPLEECSLVRVHKVFKDPNTP
jgi:hypothetical protein